MNEPQRQFGELGYAVPGKAGELDAGPHEDQGDGKDADAANDYLKAHGIIPRKVGGYGLPDCLRITIGNEQEMRATAGAIRDFVKQ